MSWYEEADMAWSGRAPEDSPRGALHEPGGQNGGKSSIIK